MNKKVITNWILVLTLIIVFISGVLLGIMKDSMVMMIVHKFSAVIFVIANIIHILQHTKRKGKNYVS